MKSYYDSLSKERKKYIKVDIQYSEYRKIYKKIKIYKILSILSIIFIILDIYIKYYNKMLTVIDVKVDYIIDVILILVLTIFYYKLNTIKDKILNKYALALKKKEDRKKNKSEKI